MDCERTFGGVTLLVLLLLTVYNKLVERALLEPAMVSEEQLTSVGIHFLTLSDGRLMEYHMSGDPQGKPFLAIQGTLQTGRSLCRMLDSQFRAHEWKAICPTLPGYGYSNWTDSPISEYWRDVVQLADHLGIDVFEGIGGWSGGGLVAASITSSIPTRVKDLLLIVAAPPSIDWYNYSFLGHQYLKLSAVTRVTEVLTHFLVLPMIRAHCSQFFSMSMDPAEMAMLFKEHDLNSICTDMVESVKHCERGYSSLSSKWFVDTAIDWDAISGKSLNFIRTVTIVYGEQDTLITPLAAHKYHQMIGPTSHLYQFPGAGHAVAGMLVDHYIGVLWGTQPDLDLIK